MRATDGGGRRVRTSERPRPPLRREQGNLKTFSNAKARPPARHLLTARGAAITKLVAARLAGACTRSLALGDVGMTCFGTGGRKTPHFHSISTFDRHKDMVVILEVDKDKKKSGK